MPRTRTRRTVSRSHTPQSPRRSISVTQASPARRSARGQGSENVAAPYSSKSRNRFLTTVKEEKDSTRDVSRATSEDDSASDVDHKEDLFEEELSDASSVASDEERQARLAALDLDLITDCLPSLYLESLQILSLFNSNALPQIIDEIKSSASSLGRRYRSLRARFDLSSDPCRSGTFISIDLVVQKLIGSPGLSANLQRPDAILLLANLATLISNLVAGTEETIGDTLDIAFNTFPGKSLLGSIEPSRDVDTSGRSFGTTYVDATIDLGLSLRTQSFVRAVGKNGRHADFNLEAILQQTFFDDDGTPRGFEDTEDQAILEKVTAACRGRLKRIRKFFSKNNSRAANLADLRGRYSWTECLISAIKWAHWRKGELTTFVAIEGGPEEILKNIATSHLSHPAPTATPTHSRGESSKQSRTTDRAAAQITSSSASGRKPISPPQATPVSAARSRTVPDKSLSRKLDRLNQYKVHFDQDSVASGDAESRQATRSPLPNSLDNVVPMDNEIDDAEEEGRQEDDGEEEEEWEPTPDEGSRPSLIPSQQTKQVLEAAKRQLIASNKENLGLKRRLDDEQPGARSAIRSEDKSQAKGKGRSSQHVTNQPAEDDDDDFEVDSRKHKKIRFNIASSSSRQNTDAELSADDEETSQERRVRPPPSAQPNPPRKSPAQSSSSGPSISSSQPRLPPSPIPPRSLPLTTSPPSPCTHIQRANHLAKLNTRRLTSTLPRHHRPQIRRKWTDSEINRLMDLIALHGTSWSRIRDDDLSHPLGSCLEGRDQVALKDKARNIKMDFLKAGHRLPVGFGAVSIKKSDMERLDELGIPHLGGEGGRGIEE